MHNDWTKGISYMNKISCYQIKLSFSTYVLSKVYDANTLREIRLLSLFYYCIYELVANKQ